MSDANDILEESYLEMSVEDTVIVEHWRHLAVTGATPTARKINASNRTPVIGAALAGTSLVLKKKRVDPESGDFASGVFRTIVQYGKPTTGLSGTPTSVGDPPIIEAFGTLETVQTNTDKDGNLIEIDPPSGTSGEPITPRVNLLVPRAGLRITNREPNDPTSLIATYVGHVNSSTFLGQPKGTWLVGPIRGRSDDGGETYVTSVDLLLDKAGWSAKLRWEDENGRLYDPEQTVDIFPEIDLNNLL